MPVKWDVKDYETLEQVEGLLDDWGEKILGTLVPKDDRLRVWLGGRVPDGHNKFGLAGDEELLFGLAVDLRQFMGGESEEHLDCCNAALILFGQLLNFSIDHGEYIVRQTPLNKFYRQLNLSGLNEFADTIDEKTIRRQRLIERMLGFADDLCELYSDNRPLTHYYENDEALFHACKEVYIDACKSGRTNERLPVGDGPYGNGVYGPEGAPASASEDEHASKDESNSEDEDDSESKSDE